MSFYKCKFQPHPHLDLNFFFFPLPWNPLEYRAASNLVFHVELKCSFLVKLVGSSRFFFIFCQNQFSHLSILFGLPAATEQTLGLSTIAYLEHLWGKISCFLLNVRLVNLRLMNRVPGPSHGGGSPRKERLAVFSWLQEGCLL